MGSGSLSLAKCNRIQRIINLNLAPWEAAVLCLLYLRQGKNNRSLQERGVFYMGVRERNRRKKSRSTGKSRTCWSTTGSRIWTWRGRLRLTIRLRPKRRGP